MLKKVIKIIGGIFLVIALMGVAALFFASRGLSEGKNLVIEDVEIESLEDGIYTGGYEAGRWTNSVEVAVRDGRIISIQLLEGFNQENARETVYQGIIHNQTLMVDVHSGATVSSKAYLKAVENALQAP